MTWNTTLCRYTSGALQMAFWDSQKVDPESDKIKLSQCHVKGTRVVGPPSRKQGKRL